MIALAALHKMMHVIGNTACCCSSPDFSPFITRCEQQSPRIWLLIIAEDDCTCLVKRLIVS